MKATCETKLLICIVLQIICKDSSAFFFKWPFAATSGAATVNFGFLRPAIIVPVTTTTTEATTTTTESPSQTFINALLANTNNSIIALAIANALASRPVLGGITQPFPGVIGGGGILAGGIPIPATPQVIGGHPIGGGGFVLPGGFPASGGVASSGLLPGFFPGLGFGRSSKGQDGDAKSSKPPSNGKVIFASKK